MADNNVEPDETQRQSGPNLYAGNRVSLRTRSSQQIQRVDFISNSLGPLGDILVSTIGGVILGGFTAALGAMAAMGLSQQNHQATVLQDIPGYIGIIFGFAGIGLLVMMTNPSYGMQLFVTTKSLFRKISQMTKKKGRINRMNIFKVNKDEPDVIESMVNGAHYYMAIYIVRGSISPVSFAEELNATAYTYHNLLLALERNTTFVTINSVQKSLVEPMDLPKNMTQGMIDRRDLAYEVASNLPNNQNLRTTVVVSSPSLATLDEKSRRVEQSFQKGLVVGAQRLDGNDARKEFKRIYS